MRVRGKGGLFRVMSVSSHILRLRMVVLLWLALGVLAIPLIHIHPEADHRHGNADHEHGGMFHTVFSPDLPCEYAVHGQVASSQGRTPGSPNVVGQTAHVFNHLEIDYFLLTASLDRLAEKPTTTHATCLAMGSEFVRAACSTVPAFDAHWPTRFLLASDLSARAPPFQAA